MARPSVFIMAHFASIVVVTLSWAQISAISNNYYSASDGVYTLPGCSRVCNAQLVNLPRLSRAISRTIPISTIINMKGQVLATNVDIQFMRDFQNTNESGCYFVIPKDGSNYFRLVIIR
jgi:hypothetical protein